jgi:hypothetical protein
LFEFGIAVLSDIHILDESIGGGKTLTPRQAIV